jgi:predicted HAD superfamily Cof-like phosphohydrolase
MKEITALTGVYEFHKKFDHIIGLSPKVPDEKTCQLRVNLLEEELNELVEGFRNNDIVEVADALMDLQYVLSGAIIACGLHEIAPELFEEVQRSNMSKLCKSQEEVDNTIKFYTEEKGFKCYVIPVEDGLFSVKRVDDNKTLKSINYSPCDLKPIINSYTKK